MTTKPLVSALAYIRVSSRAQDHATQRAAIEKFAALRGDAIGADDWRAEKKSAKTMDRPELQRLLAEARAGALRGRRLYLFRLDRLTRTGIRDTLNAMEVFRAGGVELLSVTDGFDLAGPHADVVISVMAWASQMERLAINERIAAARDRIESEGGRWGRPSRFDRTLRLQAHTLYDGGRGRSVREIAVALKIPRATVARELARPAPVSQKDGPELEADPPADPGDQGGGGS